MTRPVLAVLLVGTVVILAAGSAAFDDADPRNLLIGGVIPLASTAVAFCFASSNATDARRDLLSATAGDTAGPDLTQKTVRHARSLTDELHLTLVTDPRDAAAEEMIKIQNPAAGGPARRGQSIAGDMAQRSICGAACHTTGSGAITAIADRKVGRVGAK